MTRLLQSLLVITAATVCAGCTALAMAKQRLEIKAIEQEWGFYKPHKPFIYQP
jgi:hypothetical protein